MTTPAQHDAPRGDESLPFGLQVAAILCGIVGLLSLTVLLLGISRLDGSGLAVAAFAVNLVAALSVCLAAVLLRRRARAAGACIALAWILPIAFSLAVGGELRFGGLLLLLATITVAANWGLLE